MSNETCILTTKDFTILEVMRSRCLGSDDPLAPILKRKIESARVVFGDDVPENVATLSSRVGFSVNGHRPDTRVISHDRMTDLVGMFLPITTQRGLALIGLCEGQEFRLTNHEGIEQRIVLEKVHYQPEAARREKEIMGRQATPAHRKAALKLIRGAFYGKPRPGPGAYDGGDDPGPSAA